MMCISPNSPKFSPATILRYTVLENPHGMILTPLWRFVSFIIGHYNIQRLFLHSQTLHHRELDAVFYQLIAAAQVVPALR